MNASAFSLHFARIILLTYLCDILVEVISEPTLASLSPKMINTLIDDYIDETSWQQEEKHSVIIFSF
jgi:hypothetical protein